MEFYFPGKKFPALSVTGDKCSLNCAHCEGHYLRNMLDVSEPKTLYQAALKLEDQGGFGFLLSGGSDTDGKIPIDDHLEVVQRVIARTSLKVNVHTGLVNPDTVKDLKKVSPHVISFDLVGSKKTIEEVYGIKASPEDFYDAYRLLKEESLNVVPHITIGLEGGKLRGEYRAIDMASDSNLLILNSLIPSHIGRTVERTDILETLRYALDTTDARVYLGCMRERGRISLEKKALEIGVSGIAVPAKDTLRWARDNYDVKVMEYCCATHL